MQAQFVFEQGFKDHNVNIKSNINIFLGQQSNKQTVFVLHNEVAFKIHIRMRVKYCSTGQNGDLNPP